VTSRQDGVILAAMTLAGVAYRKPLCMMRLGSLHRRRAGSHRVVPSGRDAVGLVRFLVDCGMFQGGREAPARNRRPGPFDPRTLDFVLLTHAHIDHSGLLPRLCALGFAGPIFTTAPPPTCWR
jgi:glyoxylase-like metal-dependent hydrolase (beta-lactamase superfamily II)